ncbi:MAG: alpha/beta fold hydrolase [Planctomycetota bacterium]
MNEGRGDRLATRRRRSRTSVVKLAKWSGIFAILLGVLHLSGCADRLFFVPVVETFPVTPGAEEVRFESDGRSLHGWFLPAKGRETGSLAPAVVHCHGNGGHVQHHVDFVRFLTDAGLSVLMFDYRSYGQSDKGPLSRKGVVDDALAATAFARTLPGVDPDRIGLYGVSLGGTVAIAAAARDPEIASVCVASAFSSWSTVAGDHVPLLGPILIGRGYDAKQEVRDLGARLLLIVHGDADSVVKPYHADRIHDAAVDAGIDARKAIFAGADHNSWPSTHPEMRDTIKSFFFATLARADGSPIPAEPTVKP